MNPVYTIHSFPILIIVNAIQFMGGRDMSNRGGARDGAGRPRGEETVMVRVPKGCLDAVRNLISVYKNQGDCALSCSTTWHPSDSLPEPGRRIDLWNVQDGRGWCVYDNPSTHFIDASNRKASWSLQITAWRYSELIVAPNF